MSEFVKSFVLAHTMAVMRLKSEATKLYLSYLWWILEPLLYVAVFYFVFAYVLHNSREGFLAFLMCGKIPLMWYTKSLNKNANALVSGKGLMGQRDFPKHVFVYAFSLEASYKELAVYVFLLAFLWLGGYEPSMALWYLPLVIFTMLLVILSTGMLAAYITVYIPDFRMVIAMISMALLFVSGVFWDIRALPDAEMTNILLTCNPFAFLLDAHRQILMYATVPDVSHLSAIALFAFILLLFGHSLFTVHSQKIARRLFS